MHLEVFAEDSSGEKLFRLLLEKLIECQGYPHTWRIHSYRGIGHIPKNMSASSDPNKRMLLDQLPRILQGLGKTSGIDAVLVVLDLDKRVEADFLNGLDRLLKNCSQAPRTIFCLAIEEIEAWYLGDQNAIITAYPRAKREILRRYIQDSQCGTWELLADAIFTGGSAVIKKKGWPLPGQVKHEWAEKIGPLLDPNRNTSPSFNRVKNAILTLWDDS